MTIGRYWCSLACLCVVLVACSGSSDQTESEPETLVAPEATASASEPISSEPRICDGISADVQPLPDSERAELAAGFLECAEYDASSELLRLYFDDGSAYDYEDVPETVFLALRASGEDPARLFNSSIRDQFRYRRLTPPKERVSQPQSPPPSASLDIRCPSLDEMPIQQSVVSVSFERASYDPSTRCMVLYFDSGHIYRYGDVPPDVYTRLIQEDPDPGKYFNEDLINEDRRDSIRNRYPSERVR